MIDFVQHSLEEGGEFEPTPDDDRPIEPGPEMLKIMSHSQAIGRLHMNASMAMQAIAEKDGRDQADIAVDAYAIAFLMLQVGEDVEAQALDFLEGKTDQFEKFKVGDKG